VSAAKSVKKARCVGATAVRVRDSSPPYRFVDEIRSLRQDRPATPSASASATPRALSFLYRLNTMGSSGLPRTLLGAALGAIRPMPRSGEFAMTRPGGSSELVPRQVPQQVPAGCYRSSRHVDLPYQGSPAWQRTRTRSLARRWRTAQRITSPTALVKELQARGPLPNELDRLSREPARRRDFLRPLNKIARIGASRVPGPARVGTTGSIPRSREPGNQRPVSERPRRRPDLFNPRGIL
jgi:hypothetical protein